MRLLFILLFISATLTATFNSCRPMPNDGIPFFLQIDSTILTTDASTEGFNTQGITDVWVEAGANNLGAFEIPTKLPVLMNGNINFVISAGIKINGIANNRSIYPFYSPDTFSIRASLDTLYRHTPNFKYKAGVRFARLQNFDVENDFSLMDVNSDSSIYGARCGMITVLPLDSAKEAKQQLTFTSELGQQVWLEFDYKCSVPFYAGIYANYTAASPTRIPIVFVNQKSSWNKMYIKLTDAANYYQGDSYNVYFEALKPFGSAGGRVFIDNVKVVIQ